VERGDTGLGRDAYGLPRRRRLGERRAYRADDGAGPNGPDGANDDEYSQLLRRPGEVPPQPGPHQPGRSRMRPPPGRFPPSPGNPADGFPPNGTPVNGGPMTAGPANGGPMNGGSANGGPMPGRQYRLPNGRRVPPRADRPYRSPAPGPAGAPAGGMRGPWDQPGPGQPPGQDPLGANWRRARPQAPGGPPPGADAGQHVYGHRPGTHRTSGGPGASGMPGASGSPGAARFPGGSGFAGGPSGPGHAGPGQAGSGYAAPGPGGSGPAGPGPAGPGLGGPGLGGPGLGGPGSGGPGLGGPGSGGPGSAGSRGEGWGRLGDRAAHGVRGTTLPGEAGAAGQVIRQRENALPDEPPVAAAQAAVSIAPDGLESFARDLRAMRAKAELDYPEMAETSHYTMKTLVSAAGGLRLPTLPVAVAYVRACGGNVAEWEERWQKLATKITADAVKKRRGDGEELLALPEPADQLALPEPPALAAAQEPPAESGEVYVITSAKPRQPGW
jgi:hypothetical protein